MAALGSPHLDCRQDGAALDPSCRAGYIFNTGIAGIEKSDLCLLIGSDVRHEAAIINARLRKRWLQGRFQVAAIGPALDLTLPVASLGPGPQVLADIVAGKHAFHETLAGAKHPMLILGQGALSRPDGAAILALARRLAVETGMVREDWQGFNVLHTAAARVGGLDLGFVPGPGGRDTAQILEGCESGEIETVFLLGADGIDESWFGKAFVIYQGHHGDVGAKRADVILPGAAYTEKDATYVNTEGRVQLARRAVFPPGDAREDWTIIRALSAALGHKLPYDSLLQLRARMISLNPLFERIDELVPARWGSFGKEGPLDDAAFAYPISDFYRTDPISRASPTMAACGAAVAASSEAKTGTHG